MRGERLEPRLLLGEHAGDRPIVLLRMRACMRDLIPPAAKLGVQIVDIDKRARCKEGVAGTQARDRRLRRQPQAHSQEALRRLLYLR
jgi:hypothetical protein